MKAIFLTMCTIYVAVLAMDKARAVDAVSEGAPRRSIPALAWTERSDWVNVKTDVTPSAVGDGVADDTAAIQKAFEAAANGTVLYFPAGTYRITATLVLKPARRVIGMWIVGHGRDSRLVWDGPEGGTIWREHGVAHSRYTGLLFDGRGKAAVGLHHFNEEGGFETEVGHRHMAFLNFTDAGILADGAPATAETMVENSLFENCGRGIAFVRFNDYNWTIDGCEFRGCGVGVQCTHGNTYVRNSRFEGSTEVDIQLNPEHGSSVRRCISAGSQLFISHINSVAPLTVENCLVTGWKNQDGAISLGTAAAPVTIFDCQFTQPPSQHPPVHVRNPSQRLIVSQNMSVATEHVITPEVGTVYEVPKGDRTAILTAIDTHFLRDTATVPSVVFDAKRDFGARGDRQADDTESVQKAIDAAREHGKGAVAYLPAGGYVISRPLRVYGADYTVGGTGFTSGLLWRGDEGGAIVEVVDPQRITMENLNISSIHGQPGDKQSYDILQTGTGPSEITYDDVSVWGMYKYEPFQKGLWLRDLPKDSVVRVRHVQGNIHLENAARATVLLGNSYEGSVTVEGKAQERDGFLGIITRLGTSCIHSLYLKNNHSLVASDFYVEQADNGVYLSGEADDPPGRVTLTTPKMHMGHMSSRSRDGHFGRAYEIEGYHGTVMVGPAQYYTDPVDMRVVHRGTRPLEMIFWGSSFYNTTLKVDKTDSASIGMLGNRAVAAKTLDASVVEDTLAPERWAKLAGAFDDLRRLGEFDLRINHPHVLDQQTED